jgi:hypothetical protein
MFGSEIVIKKFLEENEDKILKNISDTIRQWLDENKEEIYKIIREESNKL